LPALPPHVDSPPALTRQYVDQGRPSIGILPQLPGKQALHRNFLADTSQALSDSDWEGSEAASFSGSQSLAVAPQPQDPNGWPATRLQALPPLPIQFDDDIPHGRLPPLPAGDENREPARSRNAITLPPLPANDEAPVWASHQPPAHLPPLPADDENNEPASRQSAISLPPLPADDEDPVLACRQPAADSNLPPLPADEEDDQPKGRQTATKLPPLPANDDSDEGACRQPSANLPPLPADWSDGDERPPKRRRREATASSGPPSPYRTGRPRGWLPGPTPPQFYRRLGDRRDVHRQFFEVGLLFLG
jgi:hypothetical protein